MLSTMIRLRRRKLLHKLSVISIYISCLCCLLRSIQLVNTDLLKPSTEPKHLLEMGARHPWRILKNLEESSKAVPRIISINTVSLLFNSILCL